jgi:hypothetical protein
MALQLSGAIRDNQANQIESTVNGTGSPTLEIRSGAPPANCAAADTGTVLATIALAADFLTASSGGAGSVAKVGTWTDASADGTGTAGHFRLKGGATCHVQGTVGTSGADMIVDNTSFNAGQSFSITTFTVTVGNS